LHSRKFRSGADNPAVIEILPSVDLRAGKVVRLKQGDYDRQINYTVDPLDVARSYADAGARWIHIVDLDGAKEGRCVQTELIGQIIRAAGLQAQVGGGVRSTEDVARLLDAGAARVVVGTKALQDWKWFEALVHSSTCRGKITLALDARDGVVATHGWTEASGIRAVDLARKVSDWPLAAILYTDVAKDGMLQGPNFEQTQQLARAGKIPVIASGGVGSVEHIRHGAQLDIWGIVVGRSLYEGTVDLKEALQIARGDNA
jgi:phosphoribosylformimino-5-aminoimidazole carboxamide ribotide isomerase